MAIQPDSVESKEARDRAARIFNDIALEYASSLRGGLLSDACRGIFGGLAGTYRGQRAIDVEFTEVGGVPNPPLPALPALPAPEDEP